MTLFVVVKTLAVIESPAWTEAGPPPQKGRGAQFKTTAVDGRAGLLCSWKAKY
jgi:hypothetical protein